MQWDEMRRQHALLPESSDGWRKIQNGWAHKSAIISAFASISEGAIICAFARIGAFASISKGAVIGEHAIISKGAVIHEDAVISEGARIGEGAIIVGHHVRSPIYIVGTRYFVAYSSPGMIQSGCIIKPLAWWLENAERCAEENNYTTKQQKEYRLHIEHVAAWMDLYGVATTE